MSEVGTIESIIRALVEQGGIGALFGALCLALLVVAWRQRCTDRDEMIEALKEEKDKLLEVIGKLMASYGENTAVIRRNTQAFEKHAEAFTKLDITLSKVNGRK